MSANTRQKLVELLKDDPSMIDELRSILGSEDSAGEPEAPQTVSTIFDGMTTERPTKSQTGKSVKYEVEAFADGEEEGPKALVVAYLPPELAAEQLHVTIVSDGNVAKPRIIKSRRRKAS